MARDQYQPTAPSKFETLDARDDALEDRYTYDRGDARSTLAYVSQERESLVDAFWAYRRRRPADEPLKSVLLDFEAERFGAQLDAAPHGVLLHHVIASLDPAEQRAARGQLRRPGGLSAAERLRRFDEAVGRATRESVMPHPPGHEQWAREAERQRAAVAAEEVL